MPPADAAPAPAPTAVVATPPATPAQTPPAVAAPPAKTWKDLITVDGLVDAYYMAYLNPQSGANNSLTSPSGRAFDQNSNTFTLNYARLGLGMSADNVSLRMDLGYGSMGNIINGNGAVSGGGTTMAGAPVTGLGFFAEQAYAEVSPVTNFTIDLGKFDTTAGAEVIQANKNWLYSRSFLFNAIPLVHTGLRLGYKVNDMVSVQGSVVNGWNGQGFEVDGNSNKTIGLNAAITLPMGVGIIPTIYFGKETGSTDTRFLGDLVGTYTMGNLGLNLNIDYINDKAGGYDGFIGFAPMAHYVVSDKLNVTARGEFVHNKIMGTSVSYEELTLGCALPVAGHFEFRPEARGDFSNQDAFAGATKKNQFTLTGAFLAYF
ncbi:MAG TPA: outer membrane beta-barrel protein [Polyangia bacterium]|nr:outer membrane beta-barrel protein [Polyangia bacterium]